MRKILTILLSLTVAAAIGQKVRKSKQELNSSSGQSTSAYAEGRSSSDSYNSDENPFAQILFDVTIGAVYYALVGNYVNEPHLDNNLTDYPFSDNRSGNYCLQDSIVKTNFRLDAESRFLYSDYKLFGSHTKLKIRPFQYFYFQADYRPIVENTID